MPVDDDDDDDDAGGGCISPGGSLAGCDVINFEHYSFGKRIQGVRGDSARLVMAEYANEPIVRHLREALPCARLRQSDFLLRRLIFLFAFKNRRRIRNDSSSTVFSAS